MKFLCLHGAYGSAANFHTQLEPFVRNIEKEHPGVFRWIDGFHSADPPQGFNDYFGPSPHYRFLDFNGFEAANDLLHKIRDLQLGDAPEDTLRSLFNSEHYPSRGFQATIDRLLEIIDSDPEIDGILGYSEGAMIASALILAEKRRCEASGTARRIKHGVFFAGWPPVYVDGDEVKIYLSDECPEMIDIPTCHIVGCKDPYIHGAMALYGVCNPDTAELFDHGKGHTVPRDVDTISELTSTLYSTMTKWTPISS